MLVAAWRDCETFDELRLLPQLKCEGPWINQPRTARAMLLQQLDSVPRQTWWHLNSFVESIKQTHPDFQRPAGDYDSWFIKRAGDGTYLRGFECWDEVDGALIRFTLRDVMHRLGLNRPRGNNHRRLSRCIPAGSEAGGGAYGRRAAEHRLPGPHRRGSGRTACCALSAGPFLRVGAAGTGRVPFSHYTAIDGGCGEAGLEGGAPADAARKAWQGRHTGIRHEGAETLGAGRHRSENRESGGPACEAPRDHQGASAVAMPARFLDQALGPTAISIKPGAQDKVIAALAELGLLGGGRDGHHRIRCREASQREASR